jgi:hypothetical protein
MASDHRGVAVTISINQRQIDELARELTGIKNGVPKAISGAINKLLPKGRTEVVNGLADVLTAKKSAIRRMPSGKERITIVRSSPTTLEGRIKVLTRKIGLVNFKHAVSKTAGVTFQIYKGGGAVRLRHAFRAVGRNANKHIFQRQRRGIGKGTAGGFSLNPNRGFVARLPIESMQGPSLLTVYRNHPGLHTRVEKRIADELQKELDSQVSRLLKRPARKR